jgi:hypothetical protein
MLDQATCEEPAQHALDDRAKRAVLLGEAIKLPSPPRPAH